MDRPDVRPVVVPAPTRAPGRTKLQSAIARSAESLARLRAALTLEVMLYVLMVLIAGFTRFWDLGARALHHDESLHSYFSWLYAIGDGYVHDPMMHGPFLFHANALIFKIFGSSDYTTRIVPALFGTALVGLPYLLRRQLGRVSMLAASFLLLISPIMWYYGRFIRNDIYCAVWMMLIFVGLVRWMDSRSSRWLHLAWLAWVFLFATKEVSYIVLFIFVTFIVGALLIAHSKKGLAWLLAFPIVLGVLIAVLPGLFGWPHLPTIPFDNPTMAKSLDYAHQLLTRPQIVLTVAWVLVWLGGMGWLLGRDGLFADLSSKGVEDRRMNALSAALAALPRKRRQLAIGVLEFLVVSVPLYTSMFTNFWGGIKSGSVGALFYWLAQQRVRRGSQPWFYYFVMEPVYEPIAVILGTSAVLFGIWWALRRRGKLPEPLGVFHVAYALLVYWTVMGVLLYSWAGEKMPWLSVELTLPLILIAAVFGTRALGLERGRRDVRPALRPGTWAFVGIAAIIAVWVVYRMASWSLQPHPKGQSPMVFGVIALAVLTALAVVWLGRGPALRSLALLGVVVLSIYTVHSAILLSYVNGDVAREQEIYVQTTPYVPALMRGIQKVSEETVGGKNAQIIYDSNVSWPFAWYLRDYKHATFMPNGPTSTPSDDVEFVLVGVENQDKVSPYMSDYQEFQYPMRWWFPEAMYRRLDGRPEMGQPIRAHGVLGVLGTEVRYIIRGIQAWGDPRNQAMLWRYLMYRKPDGQLDSYDMIVYVRRDLVGRFVSGELAP